MKGEVEGIAILIEGGPSTGKKLLLSPRLAENPPVPPNIELEGGSPDNGAPRGSVEGETGILDWPNSLMSPPSALRVGKVMADREMLILGRMAEGGPISDTVCNNGGGSDFRLAEAEAASVAFSTFSDLSPLSRFIDILRKNPHLPVLVEVLAERLLFRGAAGGESSWSRS